MELVYAVLAAFGGGVIGAVFGALPMFIMAGFIGFIGVAMQLSGASDVLLNTFVGNVIFGPLTGPHIAFAGGAAAAAFAAHRVGSIDVGSDILTPLFITKNASVMMIGGCFGIIGYFAHYGLVEAGYPANPIATSVIISGIIARALFGHKGLATRKSIKEKEAAQLREAAEVKISFLDMETSAMNFVIVIGLGALFSYLVLKTGVTELGFYFSAASLILIQFGYSIPLTHHITLTCSLAAFKSGSMLVGITFAIISWIIAELWENFVNSKDDTWLDTPSASISICSFGFLLF